MQILYYSLYLNFVFRKITFLDSAAASNFAAVVAALSALASNFATAVAALSALASNFAA
jgi:hypothetical protein